MRTSRHQRPVGLETMKRPEGKRSRLRAEAFGGRPRQIDTDRRFQQQHPLLRGIMPAAAIGFGFVVFFAVLAVL